MNKLFLLSILLILFACHQYGPETTEEGSVVAMQYSPEVNQTASGVGFNMDGDMVITSHTIHEDAKFNVVFKCDHGVVFVINRQELWSRLEEGDNVIIKYREILTSEGRHIDYDFIDAFKKIEWK